MFQEIWKRHTLVHWWRSIIWIKRCWWTTGPCLICHFYRRYLQKWLLILICFAFAWIKHEAGIMSVLLKIVLIQCLHASIHILQAKYLVNYEYDNCLCCSCVKLFALYWVMELCRIRQRFYYGWLYLETLLYWLLCLYTHIPSHTDCYSYPQIYRAVIIARASL